MKASLRLPVTLIAETAGADSWCTALGGTRTITAVIPSKVQWNW